MRKATEKSKPPSEKMIGRDMIVPISRGPSSGHRRNAWGNSDANETTTAVQRHQSLVAMLESRTLPSKHFAQAVRHVDCPLLHMTATGGRQSAQLANWRKSRSLSVPVSAASRNSRDFKRSGTASECGQAAGTCSKSSRRRPNPWGSRGRNGHSHRSCSICCR